MRRLYFVPIVFIGVTTVLNLMLFGIEFAGLVLVGYGVLGFIGFGIYHSVKYTLDQRTKRLKNQSAKGAA